jgi:hypothetical protein
MSDNPTTIQELKDQFDNFFRKLSPNTASVQLLLTGYDTLVEDDDEAEETDSLESWLNIPSEYRLSLLEDLKDDIVIKATALELADDEEAREEAEQELVGVTLAMAANLAAFADDIDSRDTVKTHIKEILSRIGEAGARFSGLTAQGIFLKKKSLRNLVMEVYWDLWEGKSKAPKPPIVKLVPKDE